LPQGDIIVAIDGEIYNRRELAAELGMNREPRTADDAEFVRHAFGLWGPQVFARLNGVFALAVWDVRSSRLWLARDRFGTKPIYYGATGREFAFGSELKALLASGGIARRMSVQALAEYMWYGFSLGDESFFDGVYQVPPGHYLYYAEGVATIAPYWNPEVLTPIEVSDRQAVDDVRTLLDEAVMRPIRENVLAGVLLSGGVDSSTIAAVAARHYDRLPTYSIGFGTNDQRSELPTAKRIAALLGTEHHEFRIGSENLEAVVEQLVVQHDEPFGDAANIPLYLLSKALGEGGQVVLQGDGGDEIFGGYRRYLALSRLNRWRSVWPLARVLDGVLSTTPVGRATRFARAVGHPDPAIRMALLLTQESAASDPYNTLSEALRAAIRQTEPFTRYRKAAKRFAHLDPVQQMLYTDATVVLPGQFLTKVDRATMAWGIDARLPLLDCDLTDYAMRLPVQQKVRGGQGKWVLKRAMEGVLPRSVLYGPKRGFGVPYVEWLQGPLKSFVHSVLFDSKTAATGLFDLRRLKQVAQLGGAEGHQDGFLLWKTLNLALWAVHYNIDAGVIATNATVR
jgi:asparagine synthase (glutamine-hydrolysing)